MAPTLLACGSNGGGQLAIGHAEDVSSFTACAYDPSCPAFTQVLSVVSAASHALLLVRDEAGETHLLGAGTNTHGQLGKQCALREAGKPSAQTSFRPLSIARDVGLDGAIPVKIAATWTTSFAAFERRASGEDNAEGASGAGREQVIVALGSNDFGELGGGRIAGRAGERIEHLRGGQRHALAVFTRGEGAGRSQRVVGWGAARRGELDPAGTLTASAKAKGKGKARAATMQPTELQLDLSAPISDVALGASHTLLLLEDGRVLAWGSDVKGQITRLTDIVDARALGASWNGSYVLSNNGEFSSQGANTHGQLLRPSTADDARASVPLDGVVAFAAGSEHVLALVPGSDGKAALFAGGWNEHGNLGLGDEVDRSEPVKVVGVHPRHVWAGCAASWVLVD